MKRLAIGLMLLAGAALAQDVQVDLGKVTIPAEQLTAVRSWVDTCPNLYTQTVVTVTNELGELVEETRLVVVPESANQKALRVIRSTARKQLNKEIRRILTLLWQSELNATKLVEDQ